MSFLDLNVQPQKTAEKYKGTNPKRSSLSATKKRLLRKLTACECLREWQKIEKKKNTQTRTPIFIERETEREREKREREKGGGERRGNTR